MEHEQDSPYWPQISDVLVGSPDAIYFKVYSNTKDSVLTFATYCTEYINKCSNTCSLN